MSAETTSKATLVDLGWSLDRLLEATPVAWRPIVAEYAPTFLSWTLDELWAWMEKAVTNPMDAFKALVEKMDWASYQQAWEEYLRDFAEANANEKRRREILEAFAYAVVKALFLMALAVVGL